LLKGHEDKWPKLLEVVGTVAAAGGPLDEKARQRLVELESLCTALPVVNGIGRKSVKYDGKEGVPG